MPLRVAALVAVERSPFQRWARTHLLLPALRPAAVHQRNLGRADQLVTVPVVVPAFNDQLRLAGDARRQLKPLVKRRIDHIVQVVLTGPEGGAAEFHLQERISVARGPFPRLWENCLGALAARKPCRDLDAT